MLRLHDTATGKTEEIQLRRPGEISIYTCGPTVYDVPHLGHGRQIVLYDSFRRYLEWSGLEVVYVSNVTDVDDKIANRADKEGCKPSEIASKYELAWWDANEKLGVTKPTFAPHATEFIERMISVIAELERLGYVYVTPSGAYFDTGKLGSRYGLLAQQDLSKTVSVERIKAESEKRSSADFALWKLGVENDPVWDSPWGPGRPGWHTECVAMSLGILGEGFDLHAGGADLRFPHHENERAQAVALNKEFAKHWMHHAFVEIGGEKMSKSLENYQSLEDLLNRSDPRAFRLLVLRSHYRAPMGVTEVAIQDCTEALKRLDQLAGRLSGSDPSMEGFVTQSNDKRESKPHNVGEESILNDGASDAISQFKDRLDDDFDTPRALARLFELIRAANSLFDSKDLERASRFGRIAVDLFGVLGLFPKIQEEVVDAEVAALVAARDQARADKDWASADSARDRLSEMGWLVEDTPNGTRVKRP